MNDIGILDKQKSIFSRLFLLSNKLQVTGDQVFAGEMTIRQWLLTAAVAQFGDTPPSLCEVADLMGSSHQNVKQLALKLQKKSFLNIEKDGQDMRAVRLTLTEKSCYFWEKRQEEVICFLNKLFGDFNNDEIDVLYDFLNKLYENILKMKRHGII